MKNYIVIFVLFGYFHISSSFMSVQDFDRSGLKRCYERGTLPEKVNGQEMPLPSSMETFVSLVTRIESRYPLLPATDLIKNLLMNFRVDELSGDFRAWTSAARFANDFEKQFFNVPKELKYEWKPEDFTDDEKCALHFMLSHTINATAYGVEELLEDGTTKHPREYGVVSLHSKWKHAFSLSKVLLGILAGLSGNNERNALAIYKALLPGHGEDRLKDVKVSRLYGVTIGDVIAYYVNKIYKQKEQITFGPNGIWNDASCPTHYALNENNKMYVTNSLLRGAIDGLIIGSKIEEKLETFQKLKLSRILSMYYGPTGLVDETETLSRGSGIQWCERERHFDSLRIAKDEIFRFYLLYTYYMRSVPSNHAQEEVNEVIDRVQKSQEIFSDISAEASYECSRSETSLDKRCSTPFDMFAILDWGTDQQRNFQAELLGNLSVNFNVGPGGSSVGVYSNMKSQLSSGLSTIINNTGISGCQSCFTKYYQRTGGKNSDIEIVQKLNETMTDFVESYENTQNEVNKVRSGIPAKVVLYFSYNTAVNDDYRLRDALWEFEKCFREVTILGVGPGKDSFKVFTLKDDHDIFQIPSGAANAADLATKLRSRICKVPAEIQFKECYRNSRSAEQENRQELVIGLNKRQYWAMYPKYFLKSYSINLKFKPQDGAHIKVCFTRSGYLILDDNPQNIECYESSGEEIRFNVPNPCKRRNVHNCDPFYFIVEGKKSPNGVCQDVKCSTPKDIQFEFQHEGISCNAANFVSISALALFFSALLLKIQKQ